MKYAGRSANGGRKSNGARPSGAPKAAANGKPGWPLMPYDKRA